VAVALATVTGGRLEGGPGSVADGEEEAEVSGDGRLGFCDKELLWLLLKIRGKGGGLPRFGFEREGVVPCCWLLRKEIPAGGRLRCEWSLILQGKWRWEGLLGLLAVGEGSEMERGTVSAVKGAKLLAGQKKRKFSNGEGSGGSG
jgi:hypothetical protein